MARITSDYPGAADVFINATKDFNPGDAIPSSDFERALDAIKTIQTKLGITGGTALFDSAVTINNSEADKDFRVAAVGISNAIAVQGSDGAVTLGGPLLTLTGGQIAFPASQNKSADANTLDDYEEGTWTPVFTGEGGSVVKVGSYTKIGNMCFFHCYIIQIESSSAGSAVSISGLPFTSFNTSGYIYGATVSILYDVNWPASAKQFHAYIAVNSATITLAWSQDDDVLLNATGTDFDKASAQVILEGFYRIVA